MLQQGSTRAELVSDRELPDLLGRFLDLLRGALLPFIGALRDGEAPAALAELFGMCREAAPRRARWIEIGTAAALATLTADALRRIHGPLGIHVRRVPDAEGVPPPPDLTAPTMSRIEPAEATDPSASVAPFRILVPGRVADATGGLRTCDTAAAHHLALSDVEDALVAVAEHLGGLLQTLPKPEPTTQRTRGAFIERVSRYVLERTGRPMDAVTAALYNLTFGTDLSVDRIRRTRERRRGRR